MPVVTLSSKGQIAFADAFAAQLSQETQAPLATRDPEIQVLETEGVLQVDHFLKQLGALSPE